MCSSDLGVTIANSILPLVMVPYLARVLGPGAWGMVLFAQAVAAWPTLIVEFGFVFSATRDIARHSDDPAKLREIVSEVMTCKAALSVLGVLLGAGAVGLFLQRAGGGGGLGAAAFQIGELPLELGDRGVLRRVEFNEFGEPASSPVELPLQLRLRLDVLRLEHKVYIGRLRRAGRLASPRQLGQTLLLQGPGDPGGPPIPLGALQAQGDALLLGRPAAPLDVGPDEALDFAPCDLGTTVRQADEDAVAGRLDRFASHGEPPPQRLGRFLDRSAVPLLNRRPQLRPKQVLREIGRAHV